MAAVAMPSKGFQPDNEAPGRSAAGALSMDPVGPEEAWERLSRVLHFQWRDRVPVERALGRVLVQTIRCPRDLPAEARALRDGYALGALEQSAEPIPVEGESVAGKPWNRDLPRGSAIRVRTGSVVPEGSVAVVPLEEVEELRDGSCVRLRGALPVHGAHIGPRGHLFRAGEPIMEAGRRLGPGDLCLLIAAGVRRVWVGRRPVVDLVPSGSELAVPGAGLGPGQSFVSHVWYLACRVTQEGGIPRVRKPVPDNADELCACIQEAARRAHLVVTTGGTGPSDRDLLCQVLGSMRAQVLFRGVRMRPGRTISAFLVGSTPVITLPGGAGGVGLGCELFVSPAVRMLQGCSAPGPGWVECRVAKRVLRDPDYHKFVEAGFEIRRGVLNANPLPRSLPGAGLVPLQGEGWIHVPPGHGSLPRRSTARVLLGQWQGALGAGVGFSPQPGGVFP